MTTARRVVPVLKPRIRMAWDEFNSLVSLEAELETDREIFGHESGRAQQNRMLAKGLLNHTEVVNERPEEISRK